jgi:hypothetical protein
MKIVQEISLISVGSFEESNDWSIIRTEIRGAISLIVHPSDSLSFTINPTKHGNGVTPIKEACMIALKDRFGWRLETPIRFTGVFTTKEKVFTSKVDAARATDDLPFALEWETGNISSSHRAINKMVLGFLTQTLVGGILILPSRKLYHYLTDRIGNYDELFPYFDVWRAVPFEKGFIAIFVIEHDQIDSNVPTITKGTDGRALV